MKILHPSFANPETWRNNIIEEISKDEWKRLRLKILERDNHTCQYCGFKADKWQIVHHIDGNPNNNLDTNLETICQMCNLIHHAGQGCEIQNVVKLYEKSKYSQNEIIQITRKMRSEGKNDGELIIFLGLKDNVPFKMDRLYLKNLFGFVTSKKAGECKRNDIINRAVQRFVTSKKAGEEGTEKSLKYGGTTNNHEKIKLNKSLLDF